MTEMETLMEMAKEHIFSKFLPNDEAIEAFSIFIILKMMQS
ncbi:hypothetical protein [Acetobacterium wieringae]|nr:hypothetical protein [Acetobacterium wieringae]MEA4806758.1 hypothetical protein [Acetobacterium wieringae]